MAARTVKAERLAKKLQTGVPTRHKLSTRKPAISEAHAAVIDAYFKLGCVSQGRALLACGYARGTANKSDTVFGRDDVKAEIARRRKLIEKRREMSENDILAEFEKLARANVGDLLEVNEDGTAYMDFNRLTFEQRAAISEFQVETYDEKTEDGAVVVKKARVKFSSKQSALDSLAKIKGLYKDRIEVSGVLSLVERIQQARQRTHAAKEDKPA